MAKDWRGEEDVDRSDHVWLNDERIEFNSEWITTIQRMLTYDWFYALPSNRLFQVIEFPLDNKICNLYWL